MAAISRDRGREVAGPRATVYQIMDFLHGDSPTGSLAAAWLQRGGRLVTMFTWSVLMLLGTAYGRTDDTASPKKIATVEGIIPAGPHPEFPALQVLANILSTQPSGRLYTALIESQKATRVSAAARSLHDPGMLSIQAEVPRDGGLDDVRDSIIAVVEALGTQGVTAEEVERARQQILKGRDLAAAETSQLAIALSGWAAQGD